VGRTTWGALRAFSAYLFYAFVLRCRCRCSKKGAYYVGHITWGVPRGAYYVFFFSRLFYSCSARFLIHFPSLFGAMFNDFKHFLTIFKKHFSCIFQALSYAYREHCLIVFKSIYYAFSAYLSYAFVLLCRYRCICRCRCRCRCRCSIKNGRTTLGILRGAYYVGRTTWGVLRGACYVHVLHICSTHLFYYLDVDVDVDVYVYVGVLRGARHVGRTTFPFKKNHFPGVFGSILNDFRHCLTIV